MAHIHIPEWTNEESFVEFHWISFAALSSNAINRYVISIQMHLLYRIQGMYTYIYYDYINTISLHTYMHIVLCYFCFPLHSFIRTMWIRAWCICVVVANSEQGAKIKYNTIIRIWQKWHNRILNWYGQRL